LSLIIVLRNTSELAPVSNYTYHVTVGDGSPEGSRTIAMGTVTGHKRDDGWERLVQKMLHEEGITYEE